MFIAMTNIQHNTVKTYGYIPNFQKSKNEPVRNNFQMIFKFSTPFILCTYMKVSTYY